MRWRTAKEMDKTVYGRSVIVLSRKSKIKFGYSHDLHQDGLPPPQGCFYYFDFDDNEWSLATHFMERDEIPLPLPRFADDPTQPPKSDGILSPDYEVKIQRSYENMKHFGCTPLGETFYSGREPPQFIPIPETVSPENKATVSIDEQWLKEFCLRVFKEEMVIERMSIIAESRQNYLNTLRIIFNGRE